MDYYLIPTLSEVYLEDSFVLAILEKDDSLIFDLDVVLKEDHPCYEHPHDGEQYCYKRGSLCFSGISSIKWMRKPLLTFYDSAGESDYGNIDAFHKDGDQWFLEGDWGALSLKCSNVELKLKGTPGH